MENKTLSPYLPINAQAVTTATYHEQALTMYRDNPLIEALPPILSMEAAIRGLSHPVPYDPDEKTLPLELRLHCPQQILGWVQPLPIHLDLEQRLSRLIRGGYVTRNPLRQGFWQGLQQGVSHLSQEVSPPVWQTRTATSFTVLGISGIGKTTALNAILQLYPQVVVHHEYRGQPFTWVQLVWLKLNCPFDGSIKGLCLNFFQALDSLLGTNYYHNYARRGRASTDELLPSMARVAAVHGLGVLVIDEIQHLAEARSGGAHRMLNFFVQLVNTLDMPVVLVGTPRAQTFLTQEFRQARRGSGQGDMVWNRMQEDDTWQLFVESLWAYQYLQQDTPLTPELSHLMYDLSQGITDIAVKLYVLAQWRAMTSGQEQLTETIFHSVAQDSLQLVAPALKALRTGDTRALHHLEDVLPLDITPPLESSHIIPVIPPAVSRKTTTPPQKARSTSSHKKARTKRVCLPEGSLPALGQQAQQQAISCHDVLEQASLLRSIQEYIPQ